MNLMKTADMGPASGINPGRASEALYVNVLDLIERYAKLETSVSDVSAYLCAMGREIYWCICAEQISEDSLEQAVSLYIERLCPDRLFSCGEQTDNTTARAIVRVLIWRMGMLMAMSAMSSGAMPGPGLHSTIQLLMELVDLHPEQGCVPPEHGVAVKLLSYTANHCRGDLEAVSRRLLDEMGFETESPVRRYGHPIDSTLVQTLDSDLINDAFRTFVNFNADRAMGTMVASSIPVTEKNYPALNRIVDECVERLGIRRPYVIVTNHMGGINAMAFGSDDEPYVAVTSLMSKIMSEDQMRFVIGHECGHIAMGHMVYHTAATMLGSLSQYIPVVGKLVYSGMSIPLNAWARRSEITADRAGLHCCKDPEIAKKTLLQIETAFNSAEDIDLAAYLETSKRYLDRSIVRKVGEYGANHPMTPKRIEALDLFANSELYYEMMGLSAPAEALSAAALEKQIEKIVRVL